MLAGTLSLTPLLPAPNVAHAVTADMPAHPLVAFAARIAGDEARTRIVLDFDRAPTIETRYIANPDRIVIDLPATAFAFAEADLKATGLFSDIRYGSMDAASARLVLTAARPARLAAAEVQANEDGNGYRLVLDAELVPEQDFAALVSGQAWTPAQSDAATTATVPIAATAADEFVIAIDAGHGGIDAGATGASTKTSEKDITLAFAKILSEKLKDLPGIRAVMTRDTDKFLSLSERVLIARQKGADLLISLHADTLRQADIRGATVYTISDKASDHMAAQLAERENFSDTVGGVALPTETEPEVGDILLDLTRRETVSFSEHFASSLVRDLRREDIRLINRPKRSAGFKVLTAPDVPSVLVELGFLSNREDEKLLTDAAWRKDTAAAIARAVMDFFGEKVAEPRKPG